MATIQVRDVPGYGVLARTPESAALRRRLVVEDCQAPHLIDAEFGHALRHLVRTKELDADEARLHLFAGPRLIDVRHPVDSRLALGAWALRDNLTFYDALYVVLASTLSATLLTADGRLARSPALGGAVELVGA